MVKGVNKTVIEVNETGSKIFEKVVFYVSPKYVNLSAKQLKRAAEGFNINSDEIYGKYKPLRQKWFKRRLFCVLAYLLSVTAVGVGIYYLFIK